MKKFILLEEYLDESILADIAPEVAKRYRKGILSNLEQFIHAKYPNCIGKKDNKTYVNQIALDYRFVDEYLNKEECDYSAEDFALSALRHFGMPPIEAMSVASLEITIRKLFNDKYKDKVYIRRVQGHYVACLNWTYNLEIPLEESVASLIEKQKVKAERKRQDTDEWREYDEETAQIAYIEELIAEGTPEYLEEYEDGITELARALLYNDDFINRLADLVVKKITENKEKES